MRRCGRTPDTVVRVLSDGEDGMRTMLGRWLDPTVEHRLDWWHLYRRLEKMREGLIYLPFIPGDDTGHRLRVEAFLKSLVAPASTTTPGVVLAAEMESRFEQEEQSTPESLVRRRWDEALGLAPSEPIWPPLISTRRPAGGACAASSRRRSTHV